MEDNFTSENFEKSLRESTDEFRMYPSKRVWHGLYNDLHPGKRWPSFTIVLLLITAVLYLGITNSTHVTESNVKTENTNPANSQLAVNTGIIADEFSNEAKPLTATVSNTPAPQISYNNATIVNETKRSVDKRIPSRKFVRTANKVEYLSNTSVNRLQANSNQKPAKTEFDKSFIAETNTNTGVARDNTTITVANKSANEILRENDNVQSASFSQLAVASNDLKYVAKNLDISALDNNVIAASETKPAADRTNNLLTVLTPKLITTGTKNIAAVGTKDETGWMEDFALRNLKKNSNFKSRLAYEVYVTPSVGFRTLSKNNTYEIPPVNSLIANPGPPINYKLNHSSAINLEVGTSIIYSVSRFLKARAGVQVNYTNYRVNAFVLNHPTFTSLLLNEHNLPVVSTRTTNLANTTGPSSTYINNNSYQLSIPLGVDFKIAGNQQLSLFASGTLQPTYVFAGNTYLVSADLKNYVADQSFTRRFNLNAGVGAYLSFKTKSGVVINAGPQFRYQLLSSYNKKYSYNEILYNKGFKIGMTKNF